MIYAKTVCKKPGSYVEIVPVGLRASLQYNQNGLLQSIKMLIDDGDDQVEIDREHFSRISAYVPQKIALSGGTTWVEGVFYFSDIPCDAGVLPDCCYQSYLARFMQDDCMCAFYAATVTSYAASFVGAQTIRNWLGMNKFQILPGTVVPTDLAESTIEMLLQTGAYSFKYPYISGFYVFDNSETEYVPADLHQSAVLDVETALNPDGYVQSAVKLAESYGDENVVLTLNYSDVCSNAIQKDACILYYLGDAVNILAARSIDPRTKLKVIENKLTCPVCNKVYFAPSHGPVQCDDPHCLSKAYPEICRLLQMLDLPEITIEKFGDLIDKKQIVTATDVLCIEPYSKLTIVTDLLTVLKATVPPYVCNDESFFAKLIHECNGSIDTLTYYLNNPNKMVTELDLITVPAKRFVEWCRDEYNVLTITTVLSAVHIEQKQLELDVAPIFRGNKIVLTGKFKRGDISKITAIMESYAATVLPDFDKDVPQIVITGGTDEDIDGRIIQAARRFNVAVVDEDSFFANYQIDADLQASHLL